MYRRDVKNCQPESETLRKVWELLGGNKPTYTHFKREYAAGPDIAIAREGRNLIDMKLRHLANHQVLAIAKALNTQEPPLTFPHPSETLKVDELGIVYCTDTMVGASLEYPDEQHLYTIKWQLDGDEWTAFANVDGEQKYLLIHRRRHLPQRRQLRRSSRQPGTPPRHPDWRQSRQGVAPCR